MVNRDGASPARCDLGRGALAERHFSITRTARKGTSNATDLVPHDPTTDRADDVSQGNPFRSRACSQSSSIEGTVSLVAKVSTAMFCGRGPVGSNRPGLTPCSIARRTLCPRADAAR